MPPEAEARKETARDCRPEGPDPEQAEIQQRKGRPGRTNAIAHQWNHGEGEQAKNLVAVQRVVAEHFQDIGQQRDAAAEHHKPRDIEWMSL